KLSLLTLPQRFQIVAVQHLQEGLRGLIDRGDVGAFASGRDHCAELDPRHNHMRLTFLLQFDAHLLSDRTEDSVFRPPYQIVAEVVERVFLKIKPGLDCLCHCSYLHYWMCECIYRIKTCVLLYLLVVQQVLYCCTSHHFVIGSWLLPT